MLCRGLAEVLASSKLRWYETRGAGMRSFFALSGAGGFFFLSACLLMLFRGILHDELGINPDGYGTSLVATTRLCLAVPPAVGDSPASTRLSPLPDPASR